MIDETLLDAMDKMAKAFDHVQAQFSSVRTGRATASFVDKIMVDYYGAMVPMQQLATFQVPEPRVLVKVLDLWAEQRKSARVLLVMDEAQNLPRSALEELRMLSNFQSGGRALLQSFLVGQPELRRVLQGPDMQQFRQRIKIDK